MERLAMETTNLTEKNIDKILELFPNVATETVDEDGNLKRAIDFEKLKQELSENVVDGEERYDFTWVGKKEAMLEANRPIRKTLRPDRESSVNWDTTENIYIEGDNLDALKLLQESYLGKVKMIYIDPPYNTGKDFVYRDNFTQDKESYNEELGITDDDGNRLFQNTESNGRFHSDWCSMIYSRLKLARNLLTDDGVIFISIDDNEQANLKCLCDEIFGEDNYIGYIARATGTTTGQDANKIGSSLDYLLCYRKTEDFSLQGIPLTDDDLSRFTETDERGAYSCLQLRKTGNADRREDRPLMYYPVIDPDGNHVYPIGPTGYESRWRVGKETFKTLLKNNMIIWKNNKDGILTPYVKYYAEGRTKQVSNLWNDIDGNKKGSLELKELLSVKVFDNPKPTALLKKILQISNIQDEIILDFFSGSATTAHACMQLNAEDGGNRKFIMVQLPEKTDEKSEAYKAGYKNICEIGEERIRRAGKKIQEENPDKNIDIGFRVFKVDSTNMNDVYYTPRETDQKQLNYLENNIKSDRTDEDLLYGCLLDWGVELSLPHKVEIIDGKRVHIVDNDALIACFEENIPETVIRKIANMKPLRVVFRDGSFSNDDNKINITEIFKLITPDTTVKVI